MHRATSGLAALLLIGMAGCVDLDVQNPNSPDAERALASPEDTEALIAGGFASWQYVMSWGPSMYLSAAAFEHGAPWANFGVEHYARIPRIPIQNSATGANVSLTVGAWEDSYAAINQVASGLYAIESGDVDLGTDGNLRARAYGKYVLGLAHGTVALLYDSGFVFDEDAECLTDKSCGSDITDVPLQGYQDVMTAALGYLNEAYTLANGASFTVPATWLSQATSATTLAQMAKSEAARMRAAVARTPTERAAVDWDQVRSDAQAGVTTDWIFYTDYVNFYDARVVYGNRDGWYMMPMWIIGMADQTTAYADWVNTALGSKDAFVMVTPDTRFPQGATQAAQETAPGSQFEFAVGDNNLVGARPDRGVWRWSNYRQIRWNANPGNSFEGEVPYYTVRENRLLIAEADYRDGLYANVETIVNETRATHGLNATNSGTAAGVNTSCVPKMPPTHPTNPNGCGDLWEMLKWEWRIETQFLGVYRNSWYMNGRGWGDLMEGTALQLPVPYREMQLLQVQPYDLGGVGGNSAAPVGNYGY